MYFVFVIIVIKKLAYGWYLLYIIPLGYQNKYLSSSLYNLRSFSTMLNTPGLGVSVCLLVYLTPLILRTILFQYPKDNHQNKLQKARVKDFNLTLTNLFFLAVWNSGF